MPDTAAPADPADGFLCSCDVCGSAIFGERYHCKECGGGGYDLCAACHDGDKDDLEHRGLNHSFSKFGTPEPPVPTPENALLKAILAKSTDDLAAALVRLRAADPAFDINVIRLWRKPVTAFLLRRFKQRSEVGVLHMLVNDGKLDIMRASEAGDTLVHRAAAANDGLLLEMLIDEGWATPAHINAPFEGDSALVLAAMSYAPDAVRVLVEKGGMDPEASRNQSGDDSDKGTQSAFDVALFWARRGRPEMAKVLVDLGCRLPRLQPETGSFVVGDQDPYHRDLPHGAGRKSLMNMELGLKFANAHAGTWRYQKELVAHETIGGRVRSLAAWHESTGMIPADIDSGDSETPFSVAVDGARVAITSVSHYDVARSDPAEIARRERIPHSRFRELAYEGDPDAVITNRGFGVVSPSGLGDFTGYPVFAATADGQLTSNGDDPIASLRVVFISEMGSQPERAGGNGCSVM
ncbi:hypothetical protein HK405_007415 [Cladochytrium tenue]|nr:hypothetical protein HK405_007415 [Cladochytrium tenue]